MQSFGAKSGASAAKPQASGQKTLRASGPQPSSSEIKLKVLIFCFERAINRLSDSNSLEDIAV